MRKYTIAIVCAAVLVLGVALPFGLGSLPDPEGAVRAEAPSAEAESSASDGGASEEAAAEDPEEADAPRVVKSESGREYEAGVVLAGLQDGATADDLNARLAELDYVATKQVAEDDITLGYVELKLVDGIDVNDAKERIAGENPDIVAAAQPNYIYRLLDDATATTPTAQSLVSGVIAQATSINDARKSEQWALEAVNAYDAWEMATTNGAVTVAVIDNGFLTTHEDLKSNIVATYNATSGSKDVSPVFGGHGTHVCGIVAAEANNGKGVAGVSYNAGLLPIQGFELFEDEDNGSLYAGAASINLCKAYYYIMKKADAFNIRVVNMSLGGYQENLSEDGTDQMLIDAVAAAHDAGILTVCAAGNDADEYEGAYPNYPSDWLEDTLGVIALEKTRGGALRRVYWSNYNMEEDDGQWKNISAPGVDILSAYSKSNSFYMNESGTSMAAPCVAGIAALVFAVNPQLTPDQARNILLSTAQDLYDDGFDRETGYGLVDAKAAVQEAVKLAGHKTSLGGATVALSEDGFTYNGTAWKPDVAVKLGSVDLTEGDDYDLVYSNNVNAGKGKVTVVGVGNYTGVATKTFTIAPKQVNPKITKIGACTWTGKVVVPALTLKVGRMTLKKGVDYTVTSKSKNAGIGKATVKCRGNYKFAQKTFSFKINPKGTSVSAVASASRALVVKWKRQAAKMPKATVAGYQVQVATNKAFTQNKKLVTIKGYKNIQSKVTGLKAKKAYYVRVRTHMKVGKTTYYSPWSAVKLAKTAA